MYFKRYALTKTQIHKGTNTYNCTQVRVYYFRTILIKYSVFKTTLKVQFIQKVTEVSVTCS